MSTRYSKEFGAVIKKWLEENPLPRWTFESFDDGFAILRYAGGMSCVDIFNGAVEDSILHTKINAADPKFFDKLIITMKWISEYGARQDLAEKLFRASEARRLNKMLEKTNG